MLTGIIYIISACFCWGLVFAIPPFIQGFSSLEIALGRCFFFGLFSLITLAFRKKSSIFSLPKKVWQMGALWALTGFLIHYFALVMSLRYLNPTIPTLILGLTPICVMFVCHVQNKEKKFSHFLIPSLLILSGLLLVNLPYLSWDRAASGEIIY